MIKISRRTIAAYLLFFICNTAHSLDSDNDGISDATELALGSNPTISETTTIIAHNGDNDPVTQGWTDTTTANIVTFGVSGDTSGGTGSFDAWLISDQSTSSPSTGGYAFTVPNAPEYGWALSFEARVSGFFANPVIQNSSNYITYSTNSTRYSLALVGDALSAPAGDVSVYTGNSNMFTLAGTGSVYHLYEIIFNPFTNSAQVYINGILRLDNYTGDGFNAPIEEIFFGSAQTSSTGQANYHQLQFVAFVATADRDGDGLTEQQEAANNTNPLSKDTDHDGLLDQFEVENGFNPLAAGEELLDPDGDSLPNLYEQFLGTNPLLADTDSDGLNDRAELGNGNFGTEKLIATITGANDIDAGDINNDATVDVIISSSSITNGALEWLSNTNGQGAFSTPQALITTSNNGISVKLVDFDNDFDKDILASASGALIWLENQTGIGDFGSEQTINATGTSFVFSTDANGDNDQDAGRGQFLAWFENTDGQGSFGTTSLITTGSKFSYAIADFDNDGDSDITSSNDSSPGNIAWHRNDGLGNYTNQTILFNAGGKSALAIGDIDADGDQDILAKVFDSSNPRLIWFENTDALGTFGSENLITSQQNINGSRPSLDSCDVDADGDADIFVADQNKIAWYRNTGTGVFDPESIIATDPVRSDIVKLEDIDSDGDCDVLAIHFGGKITWHENIDIADPLDPDVDNDGLPDGAEIVSGTDISNPDTDGDGITDGDEINVYGTNPLSTDSDSDGLLDNEEINTHNTDPVDNDTDNDGLFDGFEISNSFNPLVAGEQTQDPDSDGLNNLEEQTQNTLPNDSDSDDDGLNDGEEVNIHLTNPLSDDTDDDGLLDAFEVAFGFNPLVGGEENQDPDNDGLDNIGEQAASTLPNNSDTDTDTLLDGFEVRHGFNPLLAGEQTQDPDSDGLNNLEEQTQTTDPNNPDTDKDSLNDGEEISLYNTNPASPDSDLDQVSDGAEVVIGSNPLLSETTLLAQHLGDTDPVLEQWTLTGAVVQPIDDQGIAAWSIFAFSAGGYEQDIANPNLGWVLNFRARPLAEINPVTANGYAVVSYSTGSSVFSIDLTGDSASSPVGDITAFIADGRSTTVSNEGPDYHLYELVFNPYTQTAQFFVNGDLIFDDDAGSGQSAAEELFFGILTLTTSYFQQVGFASFNANADRDGDGLTEQQEQNLGSNPIDSDTDDDGLPDSVETNTGVFVSTSDTGTDPNNADTDGDGFNDGEEVLQGTNPLDAISTPNFNVPLPIGITLFVGVAIIVIASRYNYR